MSDDVEDVRVRAHPALGLAIQRAPGADWHMFRPGAKHPDLMTDEWIHRNPGWREYRLVPASQTGLPCLAPERPLMMRGEVATIADLPKRAAPADAYIVRDGAAWVWWTSDGWREIPPDTYPGGSGL